MLLDSRTARSRRSFARAHLGPRRVAAPDHKVAAGADAQEGGRQRDKQNDFAARHAVPSVAARSEKAVVETVAAVVAAVALEFVRATRRHAFGRAAVGIVTPRRVAAEPLQAPRTVVAPQAHVVRSVQGVALRTKARHALLFVYVHSLRSDSGTVRTLMSGTCHSLRKFEVLVSWDQKAQQRPTDRSGV